MNEMHFISKMAKKLLNEKGFTLKDVDAKFRRKNEELKKKKFVYEKQPWSEEPKKMRRKIGRFVTLMQSNFPFKMFVLQEIFLEGEKEPEIRLGYYIISPEWLKKGKLYLSWAQFNPNIPKKDFVELMRRAQEKEIIGKYAFSR